MAKKQDAPKPVQAPVSSVAPPEAPSPNRKAVRKVNGYKPAGSYILIELLEPQEVLNTQFTLAGSTKIETPQAYVLDFGPSLDHSRFGVKVGDRIALSGAFVPLPKESGERQKGIIDVNSVRAVLTESDELQYTGNTTGSGLIVA